MLFHKPCRNGRCRSSHDHLQTFFFCLINYTVKKGKIIISFCFFHQMPCELCDTDHIASKLTDIFQIFFQKSLIPLFRIIINSTPHITVPFSYEVRHESFYKFLHPSTPYLVKFCFRFSIRFYAFSFVLLRLFRIL